MVMRLDVTSIALTTPMMSVSLTGTGRGPGRTAAGELLDDDPLGAPRSPPWRRPPLPPPGPPYWAWAAVAASRTIARPRVMGLRMSRPLRPHHGPKTSAPDLAPETSRLQ